MSKEIRKQIDRVKNYKQFLNENVNTNIDSYFINRLSEQIKTMEGVINVDSSDIKYDEDNLIYFYNNTIRVIFDDTSFYGFKLEKYNQHDSDADRNKFIKHLDNSNNKLDEYLSKIDNIKNTIPKIKKVVDYVDSLDLENNINIKKVGYSYWTNQLMITIYKKA
jgi:hypothetical protein